MLKYAVRAQEWRAVNVGCPSGFKNYTNNGFHSWSCMRLRQHCPKTQCQNDDPCDRRAMTSSLTIKQNNYPRLEFKIKTPKSPSLIFKCTDGLEFIIQATLFLTNQIRLLESLDFAHLLKVHCSLSGVHLITAPHLTSKI